MENFMKPCPLLNTNTFCCLACGQEVMWYLPFPWLNESIVIITQSELPPANDLKTSKSIVIIIQS